MPGTATRYLVKLKPGVWMSMRKPGYTRTMDKARIFTTYEGARKAAVRAINTNEAYAGAKVDEQELYLATIFEAVKHNADEEFYPLPTKTPTTALPGTDEKMNVLRQRNEQGVGLWHDDDRYNVQGETLGEFWERLRNGEHE